MISHFKFFHKNNGEEIFSRASMNNIDGVQYRAIVLDEYGDPVQRVHMGGIFPYEGEEYMFTWINGLSIGNGYHINHPTLYHSQTFHGTLPNFLIEHSDKEIYISSIDFYGEVFDVNNCTNIYHFTNSEPFRNLTITAVIL
jgi:hypothetical protein